MAEYSRILVPTDFSDASNHAIDEAIGLARMLESELIVLHVNQGVASQASQFLSDTHVKDAAQLATQSAKAQLKAIEETRLAGVSSSRTILVETANAVDGICEWAANNGVDLIVIATHGRTGLSRFLLGSVTERVVRHAPCHVLTVRSSSDECCD
jgi:universal stress protein A